jgi:hypothetical protein
MLNYRVGPRRLAHLDSEWINQRFKSYQDKRSLEEQHRRWEAKAHDSFQSYFDKLLKRIEEDVKTYNEKFAAFEECAVKFSPVGNAGCRVDGRKISVKVLKQPGSCIITIEYETNQADKSNTHIEVAPDENGSITYKDSDGKALATSRDPANPGGASQMILDEVFCS